MPPKTQWVSAGGFFLGMLCRPAQTDPHVLPMSQEQTVTHVSGPDKKDLEPAKGFEPPTL